MGKSTKFGAEGCAVFPLGAQTPIIVLLSSFSAWNNSQRSGDGTGINALDAVVSVGCPSPEFHPDPKRVLLLASASDGLSLTPTHREINSDVCFSFARQKTWARYFAVVEFVAVKAPKSHKVQQEWACAR
jgi:hypothetical protein